MAQKSISIRIDELNAKIESTNNKKEIEEMKKKIKVLQQPFDQDFYLNIEKATIKNMTRHLEEICENISLDLINAEFFNFSGRLK